MGSGHGLPRDRQDRFRPLDAGRQVVPGRGIPHLARIVDGPRRAHCAGTRAGTRNALRRPISHPRCRTSPPRSGTFDPIKGAAWLWPSTPMKQVWASLNTMHVNTRLPRDAASD